MTIIYKPIGAEINIATANSITTATNVGQGCLVRIINTSGAANVVHFQYSNGTDYSTMTLANMENIIIWKNNTDLLASNGTMMAIQISYKAL
jgi:hypothetical protein